jgi:uncharacterized BrkB/YihY/UPF0761 family membrane protein
MSSGPTLMVLVAVIVLLAWLYLSGIAPLTGGVVDAILEIPPAAFR